MLVHISYTVIISTSRRTIQRWTRQTKGHFTHLCNILRLRNQRVRHIDTDAALTPTWPPFWIGQDRPASKHENQGS